MAVWQRGSWKQVFLRALSSDTRRSLSRTGRRASGRSGFPRRCVPWSFPCVPGAPRTPRHAHGFRHCIVYRPMDCLPSRPSSTRYGLQLEADRFFKDLFPRWRTERGNAERMLWTPRMDVLETCNAYRFRFNLPGVARSDVTVHVKGGWLTVYGERREEARKDEDSLRGEGSSGCYYRSISLPAHVNRDRTRATFERGVLLVDLLKLQGSEERPLPIN